jgi:hypothetical protein
VMPDTACANASSSRATSSDDAAEVFVARDVAGEAPADC